VEQGEIETEDVLEKVWMFLTEVLNRILGELMLALAGRNAKEWMKLNITR